MVSRHRRKAGVGMSNIDTALIDALGDNWMVRTDWDGKSYKGFQWADIGEWTTCPKWSDETIADWESGGLFGQGPGGYGFAKEGNRLVFCETRGKRLPIYYSTIHGDIKVQSARILHVGTDAMAALCHATGGNFPGTIALSGELPDPLVFPKYVGGAIDLSGTLPACLILPRRVGGNLYLSGVLPDDLVLPRHVGGDIDLSDCRMGEYTGEAEVMARLIANSFSDTVTYTAALNAIRKMLEEQS